MEFFEQQRDQSVSNSAIEKELLELKSKQQTCKEGKSKWNKL